MDRFNQKYHRRLKRIGFDIRISDLDSITCLKKLKNGELQDQEVDDDYADLLNILLEEVGYQSKHENKSKNKDGDEDEYEHELEKKNKHGDEEDEDEDADEDEDEDEDEYEHEHENKNKHGDEDEYEHEDKIEDEDEDGDDDEDEDEDVKDPEYCMFLENLTEHGKSYKLKISQNNEEPRFLYYEEQDNSDWCDDFRTCSDDSGDEATVSEDMQIKQKAKRKVNEKSDQISSKKEVPKRKKINDHKRHPRGQGINVNSRDNMFPNGVYREVKREEEYVEYEKNITNTTSDVLILDNVQKCSEVKNKQLVIAEKQLSLREKLMDILKHPYNEKEYKELSEYIEQEKPVSQLRPLRNGRSRLYANAGVKKSVLNYAPKRFRSMLKAAQKDPPKALNLLRMFRFWLEHVPNDEVFLPWRDEHILKVQPSEKNAST